MFPFTQRSELSGYDDQVDYNQHQYQEAALQPEADASSTFLDDALAASEIFDQVIDMGRVTNAEEHEETPKRKRRRRCTRAPFRRLFENVSPPTGPEDWDGSERACKSIGIARTPLRFFSPEREFLKALRIANEAPPVEEGAFQRWLVMLCKLCLNYQQMLALMETEVIPLLVLRNMHRSTPTKILLLTLVRLCAAGHEINRCWRQRLGAVVFFLTSLLQHRQFDVPEELCRDLGQKDKLLQHQITALAFAAHVRPHINGRSSNYQSISYTQRHITNSFYRKLSWDALFEEVSVFSNPKDGLAEAHYDGSLNATPAGSRKKLDDAELPQFVTQYELSDRRKLYRWAWDVFSVGDMAADALLDMSTLGSEWHLATLDYTRQLTAYIRARPYRVEAAQLMEALLRGRLLSSYFACQMSTAYIQVVRNYLTGKNELNRKVLATRREFLNSSRPVPSAFEGHEFGSIVLDAIVQELLVTCFRSLTLMTMYRQKLSSVFALNGQVECRTLTRCLKLASGLEERLVANICYWSIRFANSILTPKLSKYLAQKVLKSSITGSDNISCFLTIVVAERLLSKKLVLSEQEIDGLLERLEYFKCFCSDKSQSKAISELVNLVKLFNEMGARLNDKNKLQHLIICCLFEGVDPPSCVLVPKPSKRHYEKPIAPTRAFENE